MKEEIINKFAEQMLELLQQGTAFMQGQLPEVAKEVIRYYTAFHAFWVVICLVGAVACYFIGKSFLVKYRAASYDDFLPGIVVPWVVSVVLILITLVNAVYLIQILVAPRLYLLEYLGRLAK